MIFEANVNFEFAISNLVTLTITRVCTEKSPPSQRTFKFLIKHIAVGVEILKLFFGQQQIDVPT